VPKISGAGLGGNYEPRHELRFPHSWNSATLTVLTEGILHQPFPVEDAGQGD